MIKSFFLVIVLIFASFSLKAEGIPDGEQEFNNLLDSVKNPFDTGIVKPVEKIVQPIVQQLPKHAIIKHPHRKLTVNIPIILPSLRLEGVMVGQEMHQAIINDQIVPLYGVIEKAKVISITKSGVWLIFSGKKFFLKIE